MLDRHDLKPRALDGSHVIDVPKSRLEVRRWIPPAPASLAVAKEVERSDRRVAVCVVIPIVDAGREDPTRPKESSAFRKQRDQLPVRNMLECIGRRHEIERVRRQACRHGIHGSEIGDAERRQVWLDAEPRSAVRDELRTDQAAHVGQGLITEACSLTQMT